MPFVWCRCVRAQLHLLISDFIVPLSTAAAAALESGPENGQQYQYPNLGRRECFTHVKVVYSIYACTGSCEEEQVTASGWSQHFCSYQLSRFSAVIDRSCVCMVFVLIVFHHHFRRQSKHRLKEMKCHNILGSIFALPKCINKRAVSRTERADYFIIYFFRYDLDMI